MDIDNIMPKGLKNRRINFKKAHFFIVAAIIVLALPIFFQSLTVTDVYEEARSIEKRLNKRLDKLDSYAQMALNTPEGEWPDLSRLPDDMVIYRYDYDTVTFWKNEFPIGNDNIDESTYSSNYSQLKSTNGIAYMPLTDIGAREEYINLGSGWYVAKAYKKGSVKILSALLVKTEYSNENSLVENSINRKLCKNNSVSIIPLATDEGYVVHIRGSEPLFTITDNSGNDKDNNIIFFHWLGIMLALLAVLSIHYEKRNYKSLLAVVLCVLVSLVITSRYLNIKQFDLEILSPSLYADSSMFTSLADLLVFNLAIVIICVSVFMIRKKLIHRFSTFSPAKKRLVTVLLTATAVALWIYAIVSVISIVNNSNIELELYHIHRISLYSILIYLSYGLLYLGILLLIQLIYVCCVKGKKARVFIFSGKFMLVYLLVIALQLVFIIGKVGFDKEVERVKIWTNKLFTERDLSLELQLSLLEHKLYTDEHLMMMTAIPGYEPNIKTWLEEKYLSSIAQKYDITITVCNDHDMIALNAISPTTNCLKHFREVLTKYGVPLHAGSSIFSLQNLNGRVCYLAIITYSWANMTSNLFIEFESKQLGDTKGYPSQLTYDKYLDKDNIPNKYSYAKYLGNRLTYHHGGTNFPIYIKVPKQDGFSIHYANGKIHFLNKVNDIGCVVISRPKDSLFSHFTSFSYIFLIFGSIFYVFFKFRKLKPLLKPRKKTFKKKVTLLVVSSLVVALIIIGIGGFIFISNIYNETHLKLMQGKLQTIQTSLLNYCQFVKEYSDVNSKAFYEEMNTLAANTEVDINVYSPYGILIRSTKPDLFNKFMKGRRIDADAFRNTVKENFKGFTHLEKTAGIEHYALYAPIFNSDGQLIIIINIPYFDNYSEWSETASSHLAAIVNLYLIIFMLSIFGGRTIANSVTRPIAEISRKMKYINLSSTPEHINYSQDDELGTLVKSYNQMVDELEASTKELAKTERETAWKEMARQIAHEIKNPLTPMKLSIQYLIRLKQQNVEKWEERFDSLANSLIEQVDILSEVASEFSSFSKFYSEDSSVVDLVVLLREQQILFENKDSINLQIRSGVLEALVYAKKSQITRVCVNLLTNATQALDGRVDGTIRVSINIAGDYYRIDFEDNGNGVSPENEKKLFTPNFTTKSSGTGLGLAICKNIIEQSGGSIGYSKSELGGACFSFELPIYSSSR